MVKPTTLKEPDLNSNGLNHREVIEGIDGVFQRRFNHLREDADFVKKVLHAKNTAQIEALKAFSEQVKARYDDNQQAIEELGESLAKLATHMAAEHSQLSSAIAGLIKDLGGSDDDTAPANSDAWNQTEDHGTHLDTDDPL